MHACLVVSQTQTHLHICTYIFEQDLDIYFRFDYFSTNPVSKPVYIHMLKNKGFCSILP